MKRFDSITKSLVLAVPLSLIAIVVGCGGGNPILGEGGGGVGGGGGVASPLLNINSWTTYGIAATAGVTNTGTMPNTTINGNVVLNPTSTCNAVQTASGVPGTFGLCGGFAPTLIAPSKVITSTYPDAGITASAVQAAMTAQFYTLCAPGVPSAACSHNQTGVINLPAGTTLGAPAGNPYVTYTNYFPPGTYQSLTSIMVTGDLTLDGQGNPNAVFIFQSSSSIGTAAGAAPPGARTRILLINGAKASNVWWQASSSATLGLYSEFQGNIMAAATISMGTGATSCGRLLAGAFTAGQFTFDSNIVSVPGQSFAPPAGYSTTCQ